MSLLLKLREWVSLDEAMVMAANEGIFPIEFTKASRTADAISARWQLILSYSESKYPIRIYFDTPLLSEDLFSSSFISKTQDHDLPSLAFDNEFPVSYKPTSQRDGSIYVEDPMAAKVNGRQSAAQVYWENENGYFAYTWNEVVRSDSHNEAYLKLRTESLLQLFAKAKGSSQSEVLSSRAETTYQNIIGAMMVLLADTYPKRASLVAAIMKKGDGRSGLSESNLNRNLPECERVFNAK